MAFTFYNQPDAMDCGPASLRIITRYYGKNYRLDYFRQYSGIEKEGVSLLVIPITISFHSMSSTADLLTPLIPAGQQMK